MSKEDDEEYVSDPEEEEQRQIDQKKLRVSNRRRTLQIVTKKRDKYIKEFKEWIQTLKNTAPITDEEDDEEEIEDFENELHNIFKTYFETFKEDSSLLTDEDIKELARLYHHTPHTRKLIIHWIHDHYGEKIARFALPDDSDTDGFKNVQLRF